MLTSRFNAALDYAVDVHRTQVRKGTDIPYAGHLLGVAALVLEDGGSEDEAIAALLHDAAEDQGGAPRLADIRARFGERVVAIVAGCTDADTDPKPPWRERKAAYLAHLEGDSPRDPFTFNSLGITVENFERFEINNMIFGSADGGAPTSIQLSLDDVLDLAGADTSPLVTILGSAGDQVDLGPGWVQQADADGFHVFTQGVEGGGIATVRVDDDIAFADIAAI